MNQENNEQSTGTIDAEFSLDKARNSKETLTRLINYLMQQKGRLLAAFLSAIMGVVLTLRAPLIFSEGIDLIVEGVMPMLMGAGPAAIDFQELGRVMLVLLTLYSLSAGMMYMQEYLMATVSQKLVLALRKELSEKLTNVPLRFYDDRQKGEILSRVSNDLERVNEVLQSGIMRLFTSVLTIIGALFLMWRINYTMTLVSLATILAGILLTALVSVKIGKYFANRQRSLGVFNSRIEEYFSAQTEIKVFTLEEEVNERTQAANQQLYQDDKKAQFGMYVITPLIRLANQAGYVIIAALGAKLAIEGRISIGDIQAFFQYVNQASEPLAEASYVANSFQAAIASAERVFDVLDETEELDDSAGVNLTELPKGNIRFENVRFGYGKDLLMDGVNFQVKAGQKVAIVGPTGAGKTTLINLLMRFYELNDGAITIDGLDIRKFKRHHLRSLFGMVLQYSWLSNDTISSNIAYGRHKATKAEIVEAAKMAHADYFIRTLPKGYESVISDETANLSQGQKQLLCIARAFLANPHILLLDEATSSVDTKTEVEIQKAMDNLMGGRTSFVIAHRLSTIKNADLILVMDKGTIVEKGSHQELLQQEGLYSEIYQSQFAT